MDELERAGHPVVRIAVDDPYAAETPVSPGTGSSSFTDEKNAVELAKLVNGTPTLAGYLEAHLNRISEVDYFALLA